MPYRSANLRVCNDLQKQVLFDAWPDAVFITDTAGVLIACNAAATTMLAWTGEVPLNASLHELVCCLHTSSDHTRDSCPLFAMHQQNTPSSTEATWLRSDGAGIEVRYRRVALTLPDERPAWALLAAQLTADELRSEDYLRLQMFVDNNPAPIVEFSSDGKLLFGNPAMMELLLEHGYTESGMPVALPPDISGLVHQCVSTRSALENIEAQVGERTYLWRLNFHAERNVVQGYGSEVTSLKTALQSLEVAKADAEQATRAKSVFLANMSHEIRTPMNGILGTLELLMDSELSTVQSELLTTASNSADALLELINDILDFSKIEAGKMAIEHIPVDLLALLQEVVALMQTRAQAKGLGLQLNLTENLPARIVSDPTRLRQILLNLLGNAVKFTEAGHVAVDVRPTSRAENTPLLQIHVRDTGIGIAPDSIAELFTSFHQADVSTTRCFGGTGLGLAICKELAGLMGGTLGVESQLGVGSTFWLELPLIAAPAAMATVQKPNTISTRYSARVLLVEDNRVNQMVARGLLGKYGIQPDIVGNGHEAVSAIERKQYDLVLMDCHMPELDGYSATQQIRTLELGGNRHLPVVAMTANALEADKDRCMASGMDDYLSKPVSMKSLGLVLHRWLQHLAMQA